MTRARVRLPRLPVLGLSAATLGVLVLGAAGAPAAGMRSLPCVFAAITGLDCPFCGLTHGVAVLGAGNPRGAVHSNLLAPLVAILAIVLPAAHVRREHVEVASGLLWALLAIVVAA